LDEGGAKGAFCQAPFKLHEVPKSNDLELNSMQTGDLDPRRQPFKDRKVLVVEDNPVNQIVAQENLEALGCFVDLADDGLLGVSAWSNSAYDLVCMDCAMPNMDGLEATRQIRAEEEREGSDHHTPIVAITAHAQEENRVECMAAGMDDFLTKPITRAELHDKLARWLE